MLPSSLPVEALHISTIYVNSGDCQEDFHAITWFTSWAVDADHGSGLSGVVDSTSHLGIIIGKEECGRDFDICGVKGILRNISAIERAVLGFMCKDIIDMGRFMWLKEHGLESQLVKYVPANISPENHLLIASYGRVHLLVQYPLMGMWKQLMLLVLRRQHQERVMKECSCLICYIRSCPLYLKT